MQNTIHPRDLIVGLQKGLALIQLFSKTCPKLTVAQTAKMSGLTQSAARRFLLTLLHERYLQTDGRYYWLTYAFKSFPRSIWSFKMVIFLVRTTCCPLYI